MSKGCVFGRAAVAAAACSVGALFALQPAKVMKDVCPWLVFCWWVGWWLWGAQYRNKPYTKETLGFMRC